MRGLEDNLGSERDLLGCIPGAGRGDLGGAVRFVFDTPPPDLDRAEDGLEGERRGAAAHDPLAPLAAAVGQDEVGIGVLDDVAEQPTFDHLPAAFDARLEAAGEVGVVVGDG